MGKVEHLLPTQYQAGGYNFFADWCMVTLTWVMKRHKHKDAWLLRAAGSVLDDGEGPEASSSDLLKHAACGVHDKHQCRDLLYAEEPVEESLGGRDTTYNKSEYI